MPKYLAVENLKLIDKYIQQQLICLMPYDNILLWKSADNFAHKFEEFILSCKFGKFFKEKAEENFLNMHL